MRAPNIWNARRSLYMHYASYPHLPVEYDTVRTRTATRTFTYVYKMEMYKVAVFLCVVSNFLLLLGINITHFFLSLSLLFPFFLYIFGVQYFLVHIPLWHIYFEKLTSGSSFTVRCSKRSSWMCVDLCINLLKCETKITVLRFEQIVNRRHRRLI